MIDNLKEKRILLEKQLEEIKRLEKFYEKCQVFNLNDSLMKEITKLINQYEEEEFDLVTFSLTEPDKEETILKSPFEGMYGFNGAELTATREPYTYTKKGERFECYAIIDKCSHEIFKNFSFSTCKDLKDNLLRFLSNKKNLLLFEKTVNRFYFLLTFPYVSKYLESLSNWRFENKTLDIPDEVLKDVCQEFIDFKKNRQFTKN